MPDQETHGFKVASILDWYNALPLANDKSGTNMAKKGTALTPKQTEFARCVGLEGMTLIDSYKAS